MTKSEIIAKANRNIEYLVEAIIVNERQLNRGYCCNPKVQAEQACDSNCTECKERHYLALKCKMLEQYSLKDDTEDTDNDTES